MDLIGLKNLFGENNEINKIIFYSIGWDNNVNFYVFIFCIFFLFYKR